MSSNTDTGKCKCIRISLLKGIVGGGVNQIEKSKSWELTNKIVQKLKSSFNEKQQFPVLILTVSPCRKYACDNLYTLLEESHFKVVKFGFLFSFSGLIDF